MQISLPDELENRIRDRVASGQFGSPAEMVGQALRLYETYEAMRSASQTRLKADIDRGIADLQAGRISPLDADSIKKMGREALARAWGP